MPRRIDSDSDFDDDDDDFIASDDDLPTLAAATSRRKRDATSKGKQASRTTAAKTMDVEDDESRAKRKKSKGNEVGGYAWEEEYKRSWDVVREDESGSLESAVNEFMANSKRQRILRDTTSIQRGIIRHLFLVIDLSQAMTDRDLRPTRLELTLNYAQEFIGEFFDQNPISQMSILTTKDGIAERLSPLSGNPVDHQRALENTRKLVASGEPSLQNALEMARAGLAHLPTHGSREVLVIFGSLTTCDPGNIHQTIEALEKDRVRVSIVGLSAEINICKEISKKTKGRFGVVINETHFKDLFFELVQPPATVHASLPTATSSKKNTSSTTNTSDLMLMGFPKLVISTSIMSLCSCHAKLKSFGFICPRCETKLCDVPTDCGVCGLTVVSSPHLARSYRHLFPTANWKEVDGPYPDASTLETHCFGCSIIFPPLPAWPPPTGTTVTQPTTTSSKGATSQIAKISPSGRYECPTCRHHFCLECDVFHEQLGLCPGCC